MFLFAASYGMEPVGKVSIELSSEHQCSKTTKLASKERGLHDSKDKHWKV